MNKTISMSEEVHEKAKELSKDIFGYSNVSGYYSYLINIEYKKNENR